MKFGIFGGASRGRDTDDSAGYEKFIDMCVEAEDLGYYGVLLVEHHFTGFGQVSSPLNLLSYLAAKTERLRLGTAVTVLTWRNPILLAEEAATLDLLSGGRLDLGIGKGYRYNEFRGMGVSMDEVTERYDEAVEVLRLAWTSEERFDYDGKYWHFRDVVVEPEPIQKPPALWVGASSLGSIKKAAENGLNLLLDQAGSFELTAQRLATYRDAAKAAGQPYTPDNVAVTRPLQITFKKDAQWERSLAARQAARERLRELAFAPDDPRLARPEDLPTGDLFYSDLRLSTEQSSIMGTPDECIEKVRFLEDAGVERIMFAPGNGIESLRLFAKEVMPAFQ